MTPYLSDIARHLQKEFYADNFRDIAALAREAAESANHPLPFFVIWSIFNTLDFRWRERPLTDDTAKRMERHLLPSLQSYLSAARGGISPELEGQYLDEIVRAFQSWLDIEREIPWGQ